VWLTVLANEASAMLVAHVAESNQHLPNTSANMGHLTACCRVSTWHALFQLLPELPGLFPGVLNNLCQDFYHVK